MKNRSKIDKKTKKYKLDKKSETSLEIMENIMKDYNSISNQFEDKKDIFKWQSLDNSLIYKAFNNFIPGKKKLLAFDLDETLITFAKKEKSKSPNKSKENSYLFSFDLNKIKSKLDEYQKNDYIFSIFSNQNGITKGYIKESDFKNKIDKIFSQELK